jgi:hypothetical protein
MAGTTENQIGLFIATYEVGRELPGAPMLHLQLSVYTPEKKVTGIGHITQAIVSRHPFATSLYGSFSYLTVMPDQANVMVDALGLPLGAPPTSGLAAIAQLHMLLDPTWAHGVANFRYHDGAAWQELENVPARLVPPRQVGTGPDSIRLNGPAEHAKR